MNEKRIRDVIDSRLSDIKLSPRLQNAILRGARPPARLRPAAVLIRGTPVLRPVVGFAGLSLPPGAVLLD